MVSATRMLLQVAGLFLLGVVAQARPGLTAMVQPSRRTLLKDASTLAVGSSLLWSTPAQADNLNGPVIPGVSAPRLQPDYDGQWSPLTLDTNLGKTRIRANELSPIQQLPFTDQELYYPSFLFGSWKVKSTLKQKFYPYGKSYVPSNSLLEGSPRNRQEQVGSTTTCEVHYFSTLANTKENQLTVQLGLGVPKSKIIADRAFNAISISKAYNQLTPVQEVQWDPSKDPTRLTLQFGAQPLANDMRPLGPRRGEVYITARQAEFLSDKSYACAERSRSVTLASRNAIASDTESITEFQQVGPNSVKATNRIAVYLTPNPNSREGILWQQVGGKAVAFFDYEVEMERILEPFVVNGNQEIQRACVQTPKDVVQCE